MAPKSRVALFVGEQLVQRYVEPGTEEMTREAVIREAVASGKFRLGTWQKNGKTVTSARALLRPDGSPAGITYQRNGHRGDQVIAKANGKRKVMTVSTIDDLPMTFSTAVQYLRNEYGLNELQTKTLHDSFRAFCTAYGLSASSASFMAHLLYQVGE